MNIMLLKFCLPVVIVIVVATTAVVVEEAAVVVVVQLLKTIFCNSTLKLQQLELTLNC